jgi:hypothetical protein
MNQIKSVEVTENNLVIETDLPFYREYTGYMLSSSLANPWNMELHIGTTISFSKNKDNIIDTLRRFTIVWRNVRYRIC